MIRAAAVLLILASMILACPGGPTPVDAGAGGGVPFGFGGGVFATGGGTATGGGAAQPDPAGQWRLTMLIATRLYPDGGGRQSSGGPVTAVVENATVRRIAGMEAWTIEAPGADGGVCCTPFPRMTRGGSGGFVLPAQNFTLNARTPLRLSVPGMPAVTSASGEWEIRLTSDGTAASGDAGILVFGQQTGTVVDFAGAEPILYDLNVELAR